ncbi:MAG: histidine triad nucleotide-binding protein [Bacteroidota bacterium]|nr:histidine triad nucleotide-binding protein [Bacteroidota bacterium]MDE2833678.1 histidine triad nucleotide-binding protein [Bacteroidota bacterium]MDE2957260.1 histidine triad nucleotide-binding protein [Bacteroidota bacterium]
MPTLFERIISGEIPAERVYEDAHCVAFRDIAPQAPTHVLVVPRKPVTSLDGDLSMELAGHLLFAARTVARQEGLMDGYRVVINCGADGGQSVDHLHLHVMGGRQMDWPPG